MNRRVVITGLGLVAPTGNTVAQGWENALGAQSGVDRIRQFDPEGLSIQIAAEVKGFDPKIAMHPKDINRSTRFVQFAAVAAFEAVQQSGISTDGSEDRIGCSIGVGLGSIDDIEQNAYVLRDKGPRRVSPFFLPFTIPNMAAGFVSLNHKLRGPNLCTTTACSSGTHGIGEAWLYIRSGLADAMVAGGAEAAISPLGVTSFTNMRALSMNNDHPKEASRPFDANRDGFVIGEGAGVVVLEELEYAQKRGASILAELVGYGLSGDAHHITAPSPEGEGAERCMWMALRSAELNGDEIDYINAHGTSTRLNDSYESAAIARVFGPHAKEVAISSTKGVTGHCLGAAGGIEAVYASMAVMNDLVPPTANYQSRDPECPLDYTAGEAKEIPVTYALSNSFGFGGTNGSLIFKKFV